MPTARTVYVPEGTFGVLDAGEIPVQTADWSNGLTAPMSHGALIATGIHTGQVRVTAEALNGPPDTSADEAWEEVVEVSVHAPAGRLQVESLEDGPVPGHPLLSPSGPSWYRLRVHARGRSILPDKVATSPVEDYLLLAWPSSPADAAVLRSSERIDYALAHSDKAPAPSPAPTVTPRQDALRRRLLER
ncbi:hypothetical protein AB0D27_07270 [Streptomyces sp. NPDC048415]|uniref:hypothetical protein n=1 Tax=Streptomyces sp. NPDC048415 TaxID=3154822 RepID=UPI0034335A1A